MQQSKRLVELGQRVRSVAGARRGRPASMIWQAAELKQASDGITNARLRRLAEPSEGKLVSLDALSNPQLYEQA